MADELERRERRPRISIEAIKEMGEIRDIREILGKDMANFVLNNKATLENPSVQSMLHGLAQLGQETKS